MFCFLFIGFPISKGAALGKLENEIPLSVHCISSTLAAAVLICWALTKTKELFKRQGGSVC